MCEQAKKTKFKVGDKVNPACTSDKLDGVVVSLLKHNVNDDSINYLVVWTNSTGAQWAGVYVENEIVKVKEKKKCLVYMFKDKDSMRWYSITGYGSEGFYNTRLSLINKGSIATEIKEIEFEVEEIW